jgi:formylglycine-generating enzyme required for sulfatase activity
VSPSCQPSLECGEARESCCASRKLPGGAFNRKNTVSYDANLGDFALDTYEVTVARFRRFVVAYPANKPKAGDGAHPRIGALQSGWQEAWSLLLPQQRADFEAALSCDGVSATWTALEGAHEEQPINCLNWYEAFAFCAWDRGRLPTETEWMYASSGGAEQRTYPWGNDEPSLAHAVYATTSSGRVGSKPTGQARWGQLDLVGNVAEWNLDFFRAALHYPCDNCAMLEPNAADERVVAGGGFHVATIGDAAAPSAKAQASLRSASIGVRCARDPGTK